MSTLRGFRHCREVWPVAACGAFGAALALGYSARLVKNNVWSGRLSQRDGMDLRRPWSYKFLEVCPISPYEDMANVLEIIEKAKIEAIDACVCPSETKAVPTKKKGKPHARV